MEKNKWYIRNWTKVKRLDTNTVTHTLDLIKLKKELPPSLIINDSQKFLQDFPRNSLEKEGHISCSSYYYITQTLIALQENLGTGEILPMRRRFKRDAEEKWGAWEYYVIDEKTFWDKIEDNRYDLYLEEEE